MFHGMLKSTSSPPLRGRYDTNSSRPCRWHELWMKIKGPQQLHGHGPWLVCAMALMMIDFKKTNPNMLYSVSSIRFCSFPN